MAVRGSMNLLLAKRLHEFGGNDVGMKLTKISKNCNSELGI